jgi:hypothetical protein
MRSMIDKAHAQKRKVAGNMKPDPSRSTERNGGIVAVLMASGKISSSFQAQA